MFSLTDDADKTGEEYMGSPEPPKVRQQQVDPKMIIIMVVLAVMFIGICVALHLFSKFFSKAVKREIKLVRLRLGDIAINFKVSDTQSERETSYNTRSIGQNMQHLDLIKTSEQSCYLNADIC
ncbi:hypothetical protein TNCV_3690211 [Trichonephila clavipes]|uniref:Uncharacterized protein n=1 Tax=Trichonephila clavipes TaxID=2585209 RepID=A0A8X6SSP1_TRICX|nr:hypothetical protein TNCV_3690211 [Trichonephila clavipes]